MGVWQYVGLEWGWHARSTSPTTWTRAPRVHTVFQKKANHAIASPTRPRHSDFWQNAFKQRVVRTQGCTRATSTNRVTRPHATRVRITFSKRYPCDHVPRASASPAPHSLSIPAPTILSFLNLFLSPFLILSSSFFTFFYYLYCSSYSFFFFFSLYSLISLLLPFFSISAVLHWCYNLFTHLLHISCIILGAS